MSNYLTQIDSIKTRLRALIVTLAMSLFVLMGSAQRAEATSPPTISPATGIYLPGPSVTLTASGGASIYYTLDGTQPTTSSQLYSDAFTVNATTTVNAIAVSGGTPSTVATATFTVDPTIQPLMISSTYWPIVLWLRSDVGVQADSSGNVSGWVDSSGAGNDASQSTSDDQPSLVSNDWNGHPSVTTSSGKYFNLPSGFANLSSPIFYFVTKPTSDSNGVLMDLGNGSASDNVTSSSSGSSATFSIYDGSTASSFTSSSALTLGQYQELNNLELSFSGETYTNATETGGGFLYDPNDVTRSTNHIGCDYSGAANFYEGGFLEILAYENNTADEPNFNQVDLYMLSRYQLLSAVPEAPIISVSTGTLDGPTQVAIATPGNCQCYYTLDDSTPSSSSPLYQGPLTVSYSQTLKAIAVANGVSSSVSSAAYTLDSTQWPAPSDSDTTPLQINVQSPTN